MDHGLGSTHVSLTLANYLCSKLGKKVAYIERNSSNHIQNLVAKEEKLSFQYMGIVFFPNISFISLPEILQKDFEFFILDMGVLNPHAMTEFLRCDKSFLICSPSKWRRSLNNKVEPLFTNQAHQNCCTKIVNLCEKESTFSNLISSFETYPFPYIPNPFQIEPRHFRAISLLLKNL